MYLILAYRIQICYLVSGKGISTTKGANLSGINDELLTIDQLAVRWKKSKAWIYSNHHRLGIPVLHIGQQLRFPIEGVLAWESKNTR